MAISKVEAMCPVIEPNGCLYRGVIQLSDEYQHLSAEDQHKVFREAAKRLEYQLRRQHEDGKHNHQIK